MTQEQAAWDSDLAKSHLSQIEAGRGFPSVPVLFALAKRLGVDAVDLVAVDQTDPKARLLDALRTRDLDGLRAALQALGVWEDLVGPVDERPRRPERSRKARPNGR